MSAVNLGNRELSRLLSAEGCLEIPHSALFCCPSGWEEVFFFTFSPVSVGPQDTKTCQYSNPHQCLEWWGVCACAMPWGGASQVGRASSTGHAAPANISLPGGMQLACASPALSGKVWGVPPGGHLGVTPERTICEHYVENAAQSLNVT